MRWWTRPGWMGSHVSSLPWFQILLLKEWGVPWNWQTVYILQLVICQQLLHLYIRRRQISCSISNKRDKLHGTDKQSWWDTYIASYSRKEYSLPSSISEVHLIQWTNCREEKDKFIQQVAVYFSSRSKFKKINFLFLGIIFYSQKNFPLVIWGGGGGGEPIKERQLSHIVEKY